MAPHARSFPGRNRIISGMSQGTAIVEASLKSGSLITARFALEQDREVFAVPGSPMDPRCKGTNGLIKQGATVCESIEDVLGILRREPPLLMGERASEPFEKGATAPQASELNEARKLVHAKLGYSPVSVDELLVQTGLTPNTLSLVLLELELAGRLSRSPGHKVTLKAEESAHLAELT
jgi:DNA processing protein